jgi:hypothetical protein
MDYKEKILKYQKEILIIFALLDAMLLGRCIFKITFFRAFSHNWWFGCLMLFHTIVVLSLSFSAFGLVSQKRWAFVLSYCQFPFRYVFFLLSFAFITKFFPLPKIPFYIASVYITPAIIIAMILEIVRLAITIIIHKNSKKILKNH